VLDHGHGAPVARGVRAGWRGEGDRARVPGERLGEAGTGRGEFHNTLRETDENDEMLGADSGDDGVWSE